MYRLCRKTCSGYILLRNLTSVQYGDQAACCTIEKSGFYSQNKNKDFLNSVSAINFLVVSTGIKRPEGETDPMHFEEPKNSCTYTILPPTCLNGALIKYEQGQQYRYRSSIAHGTRHCPPRQHTHTHIHTYTHTHIHTLHTHIHTL
jgi:hypothetical protein